MAFNTNAAAANVFAGNQQQDDSWKAQGFINIYLSTKSGESKKIGTIYLHENKPLEKQLLDRLKVDEEALLEALQAKIELRFNLAGGNTNDSFDI